ncbi:MAG: anthranilate phosphoribosyltransferase [Betaproteobacteria bacterium]|nr:anthranilate phosphoribosyltransferase [Betaproteobacteria bacterium]
MPLSEALNRLVARQDLSRDEMLSLMRQVMAGDVLPTQLAAFLMALRVKRESVEEIAAAAQVMREFATPVPVQLEQIPGLVDLCGTGGDGAHTFNISTTAMFVAAAAGAKVAKHGGRAVSSSTGSADVLEALGANIHLAPNQVARCIDEVGVGFMFAPNHHAAMKHVAPVRKELGVRTIFNILGPLTNPAGARHQLMGVFSTELVRTQAEVLRSLGSQHVLVVHARNGLDEIAIEGETFLAELTSDGDIHERLVFAQQYGVPAYSAEDLQRGLSARNKDEALARLKSALSDEPGPARDIVVMNAGAALWAADVATSLADGIRQARAVLQSGAAAKKLDEFVAFTRAA